MKKLSILIALLVVATFAFAQTVEFDGDATLTLGADLDTGLVGFKNEASASLSVTWEFDAAAAGGTQAFINLTGMSFVAADDAVTIADPSVEAGLIFAPLTITIYSAPDLAFASAEGYKFVPDDPDDPLDAVDPELSALNTGTASSNDPAFEAVDAGDDAPDDALATLGSDGTFDYYIVSGFDAASGSFQGLTVTADIAPLTVDLMIASDGDWTDNTLNGFAYGVMVGADIAPLTVSAGALIGANQQNSPLDLGFTVAVGAAVGPATVDVGADIFDGDIDTSIDVGLDLGVASISSLTYLTLLENADEELDVEGYQQLVIDASAALDGLTLINTTQLDTFFTPTEWYNGTEVAYDLGGIKPFGMVEIYDTTPSDDVFLETMDVEVGVELTGQIELTTMTLTWDIPDALRESTTGGVMTFAVKVEY